MENTSTPQDLAWQFLEIASSPMPTNEIKNNGSNNMFKSGLGFTWDADTKHLTYLRRRAGTPCPFVIADDPVPVEQLVYYFEIHVRDDGTNGKISVGFTACGFTIGAELGLPSCRFEGPSGRLFCGSDEENSLFPTYTSGDMVGAGIDYSRMKFFFTKNGMLDRVVENVLIGPVYPTICVDSQNEVIQVNFGMKPFSFDLKEIEAQARKVQQDTIEKLSLPSSVSYSIVRSYLQHYGYEDTLIAFDKACKNTVPPTHEPNKMYALKERKILRQLIQKGEIDRALEKLNEWYPQIVQDTKSATYILLQAQKFIEFIRNGKSTEAMTHAKNESNKVPGFLEFELVKLCGSLLLCNEPKTSKLAFLLGDRQREIVADSVNAMVLSTNPNVKDFQDCLHSSLERLLRQITLCSTVRKSINRNDVGEVFNLHRRLHISEK